MDILDKIPDNWVWTTLEQIADMTSGGTPSRTKKEYWNGNINWLKSGELKDTYIHEVEEKITEDGLKGSSAKIFPKDTLLMAMYGATVGRLGILNVDSSTNQAVCAIFNHHKLFINEYIFFYLLSMRQKMLKDSFGGAQPNLSQGYIKSIDIPFAPLNEQKKIVAKIEKLFSNLDNSDKYLFHLEKQLKRYRQSVLKSAFEGKLTKEWREKQINLETADELLEKIKKDREKYYLDLLLIWKEDSKKWEKGLLQNKPKKPKRLADFGILSQKELDELPTLSNSWKWTKIDSLLAYEENSIKAGPFGSSLKKSCYTETGFKIYGQEQVIANNPFLGDYYVGEDKYRELFSCRIKADDILISLVGTIGKVLILPKNCEQGIINPRLIKISLHEKNYSAKFFKFYFESSFLKSLYAISSHGATMDIINMGIIKDLPFPLCSLEEQIKVVEEIEKHFSIIDKLETVVQQSIKESKRLRQSILKQAFQGKLVEQDSNDESANLLLEKIAKAKEEYQKAMKRKK